MGTEMGGWVEAKLEWADEDDEWFALIDASLLMDRNYDIFCRLFGVRMSQEETIVPLAANRGLPATMSQRVRTETGEKNGLFLAKTNYFHSASWLTWAEIQSLNWEEFEEGYQILFQIMRLVAASPHFVDLRIVVWFGD